MEVTIAADLRKPRARKGKNIEANARIPLNAENALEVQMRWPTDVEEDKNDEVPTHKRNTFKRKFLLSDPNIEEDEVANRRWQCQRILGAGGYGIVGLIGESLQYWSKHISKHCAQKQSLWDCYYMFPLWIRFSQLKKYADLVP
jgi:hypothetical protein